MVVPPAPLYPAYTPRPRFGWLIFFVIMAGIVLTALGVLPLTEPETDVIAADVAAPEYFLLVMKSQADTAFARTITDRNERVSTVFNTLTRHARTTTESFRAELDAAGVIYRQYYIVSSFAIQGDAALRKRLAQHPDVLYTLDLPSMQPLEGDDTPGGIEPVIPLDDYTPGQTSWGITQIEAPRVWDEMGVNGTGIIIGSADTGVDWTHPDLRPNYLGKPDNHNYAWFDPWFGSPEPKDFNGHGTHTTGTMAGQHGIGVAPGAKWIGCVNLGRAYGNAAYYMECMQFLFAPFPQNASPFQGNPLWGAHIVNNSWGCPPVEGCNLTILSDGMKHLADAGQLNVLAAGNAGPGCSTIGNPAFSSSVFTVGAIGPKLNLMSFSSRGPITEDGSGRVKPDIVAPGSEILSAFPGGRYSKSQGTSMASPHVAGVVALMWSANPMLVGKLDTTLRLLETSATPVEIKNGGIICGGEAGVPNNLYGYGILNAYAAVQQAKQVSR